MKIPENSISDIFLGISIYVSPPTVEYTRFLHLTTLFSPVPVESVNCPQSLQYHLPNLWKILPQVGPPIFLNLLLAASNAYFGPSIDYLLYQISCPSTL